MGVQHMKTQFEIQRFSDTSSKGQQKCIENVTKASESDKLNVGERVVISGQEHGTLRYLGPTHFQSGIWCGIGLDSGVGLHGGSGGSTWPFWFAQPEVSD